MPKKWPKILKDVLMQSIELEKSYPREAIIIALQKYLTGFWVKISENQHHYLVTYHRKPEGNIDFDDSVFLNELIESEFIYYKSRETKSMREAIINMALSAYEIQGEK